MDAGAPGMDVGTSGMGGMGGMGDAGGDPIDDDCTTFCTYLESCGSCLYDENSECLDAPGCGAACREQVPEAVPPCVALLGMCDEAAFQACYDDNVGDTDCANACRTLEACGECFIDDNDECLSIAGCAAVCEESTPPAAAACLAGLGTNCDGISACFD